MVPSNQPVFRASLLCVQASAHALLGDYAEAAGAIGSAREDLKVADSEYLQVVTSLIESLICKESGDLERGRAIAESARNRVEQVFGRRSRVGGPLSLAYADLLYEQDRHAGVLAELPLATVWRDVATPVELLSRGQLVMAKARFFSGAAEQGLAQLDEWLSGLLSPGYERVYAHAMSCKVQFLLWLRRPNEAERVCLQLERHLAGLSGERHADAQTALVLAEARLALSERHAERAQSKLESCLAGYSSAYQRDRRLRLSLLLSVAYWQKGNSEKAIGLFLATLEEAWNLGYRRLFQTTRCGCCRCGKAGGKRSPSVPRPGRGWPTCSASSAGSSPWTRKVSMKIRMLAIANGKSCGWWRRACRTAISRRRCTCRKPPSSGTCTTCSPSWV